MTNTEIKNKLLQLSNTYNLESVAAKVHNYDPEKQEIKVAFLGEFSSGKTSLVNALIRKDLLPTFDKPTTAVVTELRKGLANKIEVVSFEDVEVCHEIEVTELLDEVQKTKQNSKIRISLGDNELLDDSTVLIDTPGVSSMNNTHSEVTYGYLPNVDVACVVINVNMGSVSESLLNFISQYPETIKSRLKFVLTHIDTKSKDAVTKIKEEFNTALKTVVSNPQIILVSSKLAIEANKDNDIEKRKQSGINEIEYVIKKEIPRLKTLVRNEREREFLLLQVKHMILALEQLFDAGSFNDSEIEQQLKVLADEQMELRKERKRLKEGVRNKELRIKEEVKGLSSDYGEQLLTSAVEGNEYGAIVNSYIGEVQELIISELSGFKFFDVDISSKGLESKIAARIHSNLMQTINWTNTAVNLANHALIAAIAPGAGAAANAAEMGGSAVIKGAVTQIANTAGAAVANAVIENANNKGDNPKNQAKFAGNENTNNKNEAPKKQEASKWNKAAVFAGNIMAQFDLLGKASKGVLNASLKKKAIGVLLYPTNRQITSVFNLLNNKLEDILKNEFETPIQLKDEALHTLKIKGRAERELFNAERDALKLEIQKLKTL